MLKHKMKNPETVIDQLFRGYFCGVGGSALEPFDRI